ncbi:MAG: type II secretion system F family protein [Candidatus Micrarchaeia archaeon]
MAQETIPFILVNPEYVKKRLSFLKPIGYRLKGILPFVEYDLRDAGIKTYSSDQFLISAFISSVAYAAFFGVLMRVLVSFSTTITETQALLAPFLGFFFVFILVFVLLASYPRIVAQKVESQIDRDLVYAVRDILVQVKSGISLYGAMGNVGGAGYGYVSAEFEKAYKDISLGRSTVDSLEDMAVRTRSQYLKKTVWQLVTTIRAGANLSSALKSMVTMLVNYQFGLIKKYNSELNFLVLIYLLLAAVVPTVGITVLVIFSVFGILGINELVFAGVILASFFMQVLLIGFIKMQRPNII